MKFVKGWEQETDIVIIGTGFAGLSTAIETNNSGLKVIILEKRPLPGGNSMIAGGGINAVDPERQKKQGIQDSLDLHFRQTFEGGDNLGCKEKIKYMVEHSLEESVHWLENMSVKFPEEVELGYGALWPRTHRQARYRQYRRGAAIVHALFDQLKCRKDVQILFNHKMVKIIREDCLKGLVQGVEVESKGQRFFIKAKKGVVLATGGFAANSKWVSKHDLRLIDIDNDNHKGATGEGIKIAQDIGADTLHMDYIQTVPKDVRLPFKAMAFYVCAQELHKKFNHPHQSRSFPYWIFINKEGKRFINEDARRLDIRKNMLQQPTFDPIPHVTAGSISELEKRLSIPKGNLERTIDNYNQFCANKKDKEWGKNPECLIPFQIAPFEARSVAPKSHFTMGGLRTNLTGQVIDREASIIPNLYAVGEVVGGLHGANRLGHNATPECIVFGRLCGKTIGNSILPDSSDN